MTKSAGRDSVWIVTATCVAFLLVLGLGVGWLAAFLTVAAGALIWIGYWLAGEKLTIDRARVQRERTALDAEWQALDRTRRVREIFFDARRAMHEEAQRYWPTKSDERDK